MPSMLGNPSQVASVGATVGSAVVGTFVGAVGTGVGLCGHKQAVVVSIVGDKILGADSSHPCKNVNERQLKHTRVQKILNISAIGQEHG
jgi:hypothetical protein